MTTISNKETLVSSNGLNPSIIKLANENFIIAYQKNSNVAMKIFDNYGSQVKDEFITAQGCLSSQYPTFAIVPLSVGGFAVACITGGGLASLHVSLWNNNGGPQYIDRFPYNPSPSNPHSSIELFSLSMTSLDNGNFALAWSCREDNSRAAVYTYTYNYKGDHISNSIVNTYSIGSMRPYSDFFKTDVIHTDSPHTHIGQINNNNIIVACKYEGDVVTTSFNEGEYSADRFALALTSHNNNYIIASENKDSNQNWQVFITYRDTVLNTKVFKYVSSNLDHNINPAIATLNNGYTAITWHSYNAIDGLSKGIFLQLYGISINAKFGQPVKVNSIDLGDKYNINNYNAPSVTSIDEGFVIAWEGNTEAGNNIYFMKFDNEGNQIDSAISLGSSQDSATAEETNQSITNIVIDAILVAGTLALIGCSLYYSCRYKHGYQNIPDEVEMV